VCTFILTVVHVVSLACVVIDDFMVVLLWVVTVCLAISAESIFISRYTSNSKCADYHGLYHGVACIVLGN